MISLAGALFSRHSYCENATHFDMLRWVPKKEPQELSLAEQFPKLLPCQVPKKEKAHSDKIKVICVSAKC